MEKLTDAEIKKALDCCLLDKKDCFECQLQNQWNCRLTLRNNTIDLINRKDAKIERLQEENTDLKKAIETMTNEHIKWGFEAKKRIENAKSEAYKEFEERLKEEITKTLWRVITDLKYEGNKLFLRGLIFENIDNTLKELMKG